MNYIETGFADLWLCEPTIYGDDRGYFFEVFNEMDFNKSTGLDVHFVQQNESRSSLGVLRGLHLQKGDAAQAKLIRVISGRVLDVVVDCRKESDTFLKTYQVMLDGESKKQLFIPRGFAHGFQVLSEEVVFAYSCDNFYDPKSEVTLRYNDTQIDAQWEKKLTPRLSAKDEAGLPLDQFLNKLYA